MAANPKPKDHPSRLNAGEELKALYSPDGVWTFTFKTEFGRTSLLISGEFNNYLISDLARAVMQPDGNFVVLNASGKKIGETGTKGKNVHIELRNDGLLYVMDGSKELKNSAMGPYFLTPPDEFFGAGGRVGA